MTMEHNPFAVFVTGTDTDIGKTLVSCALLHSLVQQGVRAVGMKPIAAGCEMQQGVWCNADVERLNAAGNLQVPQALRVQYLFDPFCAPHIAAAKAGQVIDSTPILAAFAQLFSRTDALVVEGVGGFRVPLGQHLDTADLAQQLALPVLLVVGLRLGCINHALLTAEAIAARGLQLAGWVANVIEPQMAYPDENLAALQAALPAPFLGCVPRLSEPDAMSVPAQAASFLDFSALPNWPAR